MYKMQMHIAGTEQNKIPRPDQSSPGTHIQQSVLPDEALPDPHISQNTE